MHAGEFDWLVRAARDVAPLAAVLLFAAYVGEPWIGAAATLGAGLACGLFPKARTEAFGVALLVWGVALLIGAASGARDPLRPFER